MNLGILCAAHTHTSTISHLIPKSPTDRTKTERYSRGRIFGKIAIGDLFSKYIVIGDLFSAGGTIAIGDLFSGAGRGLFCNWRSISAGGTIAIGDLGRIGQNREIM